MSHSDDETLAELDERLERVQVEGKIVTEEADIEEKKAVIAQLKKQYGSSWTKRLGVSKLTDLTTLKSFLRSANKGMASAAGSFGNSPLSPGNFKGIRRA